MGWIKLNNKSDLVLEIRGKGCVLQTVALGMRGGSSPPVITSVWLPDVTLSELVEAAKYDEPEPRASDVIDFKESVVDGPSVVADPSVTQRERRVIVEVLHTIHRALEGKPAGPKMPVAVFETIAYELLHHESDDSVASVEECVRRGVENYLDRVVVE